MAAAYNKFNVFTTNLCTKIHDLNGDALKIILSNTAPSASNQVKADITEITEHNGYTAPVSTTNTGAGSSGTYTVTGTAITITASGGTVGPFEYVVLFDDTVASPVKPLIAWWDYGSALTLNDGDSFTIKFNSSATTGTILTVT